VQAGNIYAEDYVSHIKYNAVVSALTTSTYLNFYVIGTNSSTIILHSMKRGQFDIYI
ncbi:unnamed protein product, partial [Rotaria socialis]